LKSKNQKINGRSTNEIINLLLSKLIAIGRIFQLHLDTKFQQKVTFIEFYLTIIEHLFLFFNVAIVVVFF
jgi:hypothetical protein